MISHKIASENPIASEWSRKAAFSGRELTKSHDGCYKLIILSNPEDTVWISKMLISSDQQHYCPLIFFLLFSLHLHWRTVSTSQPSDLMIFLDRIVSHIITLSPLEGSVTNLGLNPCISSSGARR
jgi:hypothetical protein